MIVATSSRKLFPFWRMAYGLIKHLYVLFHAQRFQLKQVRWNRELFDTEWRHFPVATSFLASTDLIYPVHFERGMIALKESPHFAFVNAVVNPISHDSRGLEIWRDYVRGQHHCTSNELRQRESRFRTLIAAAREGGAEFEILVDWRPLVGGGGSESSMDFIG